MTHSAVHSEFVSMGFSRKRRVSFPHNIYQVIVEGEEGEYAEYEIEADSHSEAASLAESMATDSMIDIQNIQVYLFS